MGTQRRRFLVTAATACLAGGALGADRPTSVHRIGIAVPGPGNLLFLPVTLARKIGADIAEGFEFDIRYVGGGPQAFQEMLDRNTDFSAGGFAALGLQKSNGRPVVCIAPLTRVPAYTLLVRKQLERSVKSIRDLTGKVVGVKGHVPGGRSTSQLFAEFVLKEGGLGPDRVNFVSVGQSYDSQQAALVSGTVDAIMGDEPFASRLVKEKSAFALADFHDLAYTQKMLGGLFLNGHVATRDDMVSTRPEVVDKVVRSVKRTLVWINAHTPQQFVEALQLETAEERQALLDSLKVHKGIYSPDGKFQLQHVRTVNRFLRSVDPSASVQSLDLMTAINAQWAGVTP